jgi:hypothetical protein
VINKDTEDKVCQDQQARLLMLMEAILLSYIKDEAKI